MKIFIIGNGFVGKATSLLKCKDIEIITYDINPELCEPKHTKLEDCKNCDLIFISVPTPMNNDGSCCLKIIDDVVNKLEKIINLNETLVVLRSTVTPGTSDNLNLYFMPEFLTEKNYINDFINNDNWIFGLKNTDKDTLFKNKIKLLFDTAYNNNKIKHNKLTFLQNKEAEMIKLFRNNFLTVKVSFCNEIYEYCKMKDIDYNTIINIASSDTRIGTSHTTVPGHDGSFGFGGTCFPKDISNTLYDMKKIGMNSYILEATINRNDNVDRPNKNWKDKGRSVV
jgi:nucleotide sugar dehydrogenase